MERIGDIIRLLPQSMASKPPEANSLLAQDHPSRLTKSVRSLAACYRRDDAADPVAYAAALMAVLSEYPIDVVEHVTDPRTGLPRTLKWLPSVAEVVEACEQRQRAKRPLRASLGKPMPPIPVNPHMWDDANAKDWFDRVWRVKSHQMTRETAPDEEARI